MSQKLLKKSRNRHLQQQFVENCIPNKPIKRNTFKYKPVSNLSIIKQDICNQWAFSWNQLKEQGKRSKNAIDANLQGRNFLKGELLEESPQNIISTTLSLLSLANVVSNAEKSCLTSPDILDHRINQLVGGDLLGYLDRYLDQQYHVKEKGLPLFHSGKQLDDSTNVPIARYTREFESSQLEEGRKRKVLKELAKNPPNRIREIEIPSINQEAGYSPRNRCTETAFLIKWDAQFLSVADYLKVQNSWKKLYSFDEIHGGRDRIGDQRKRQYMERRKIAILYGNLPKRTLVRLMRNALKEAGDTNSKFLSALEKRLDVVLKRTFFFPTIRAARQWIHQGKILVNNRISTNAGLSLQPGDFVTISKEKRLLWKKFWCVNTDSLSKQIEQVPLSPSTDEKQRGGNRGNAGNSERFVTNSRINPYRGFRRQFLFSPRLMQKLHNWSNLWGNSRVEGQIHQWTRLNSPFHGKSGIHTLFLSSCLNSYLKRRNGSNISLGIPLSMGRYARRVTRCTNWLKVRQRTGLQQGYSRNLKQLGGGLLQRKRQVLRNKLFLGILLHREAGNVIDGLFNFRWNNLFALKKSFKEKREDWQFNAFKPIHIECCYKQGSAVFLYSPQKLVWPCSINVSLLKHSLIN